MQELSDLLKPSFIKNSVGHFQVNDELNKVIMAVGYPRTIKEGAPKKNFYAERAIQ